MARVAQSVPWRHVDGQHVRFILVDAGSILAFPIQVEKTIRGDAETALWTNGPDCVWAHREFFETARSSGIPAKHN